MVWLIVARLCLESRGESVIVPSGISLPLIFQETWTTRGEKNYKEANFLDTYIDWLGERDLRRNNPGMGNLTNNR